MHQMPSNVQCSMICILLVDVHAAETSQAVVNCRLLGVSCGMSQGETGNLQREAKLVHLNITDDHA